MSCHFWDEPLRPSWIYKAIKLVPLYCQVIQSSLSTLIKTLLYMEFPGNNPAPNIIQEKTVTMIYFDKNKSENAILYHQYL